MTREVAASSTSFAEPSDGAMLVDGHLVGAADGATFVNVNPATEQVIGHAPDATKDDLDRAIAAARRAFDTTAWSTDVAFRRHCLGQLQDALDGEREGLRSDLVSEVGCPISLTRGPQLDGPLSNGILWPLSYMSEFPWVRDVGEHVKYGATQRQVVLKEAVGVVAAITPWNFPLEVELTKLAQVLATGNTVVLKVAPDTPAHALRMARLIAERTDFPAGVVNIVTTSSNEVAEGLLRDPRVDLVSFTGSTRVGQRIVELSAARFTRTFLELGGKSAHVVLDDADFASVVPGSAALANHAGQGCAMITRLLLPRSRYAEGVALAAEAFAAVPVGDPTDARTVCGPVINARQRDRIQHYMRAGIEEGARLVVGGPGAPAGLDTGWFVRPTLFADVDNAMTIAQEEIFGPVLVAIPYDDEDDAVRIANDSVYGLAGTVSGSPERAWRIAKRLRAGSITVNGAVAYSAHLPFGGYKSSGIGRQNGPEGFEQYLETKSVAMPAADADLSRAFDE